MAKRKFAKKPLIPFNTVFVTLLARNETAFSSGQPTMTDEQLLLELAYQIPKHGTVKRLLSKGNGVTVHKLRGQFNRGEMHYRVLDGPPSFFSFRYNENGRRIDRTLPLSTAEQQELIAKWTAKRQEWRNKYDAMELDLENQPKFLLSSDHSETGPSVFDAPSTNPGTTSSSTEAPNSPTSSS